MNLILQYSPDVSYTVSTEGQGPLIAWVDTNSSLIIWSDERDSPLFHIDTANFVAVYEVLPCTP